jgi:hypothetical protein
MAQMTGRRLLAGVAAFTLAAGLAACDPVDGDPTPSDTTATTEEPSDDPTTVDPTDGPSEDPSSTADPRVTAAVDDLAERLGLEPDQIIVGPLEDVTWSDGSIGCPKPGEQYTQALIDGQRIILTVTGTEYFYHSEGDGDFFYCEQPVDPAPSDDATA